MPLRVYSPANVLNRNREITIGVSGHTQPVTYELNGQLGPNNRLQRISSSNVSRVQTYFFKSAPDFDITDTLRFYNPVDDEAIIEIRTDGPLAIITDIIKTQLELDNDQVYIYNQEVNIPQDGRLYIVVGFLGITPYSYNSEIVCEGNDMFEVSAINSVYQVEINIFSKGEQALFRKEEVLLALRSQYSQNQQVLNGMSVSRTPTQLVNLSPIEGPAILYRFNMTFNMHYNEETKKEINQLGNPSHPIIRFDR